MGMSKIAQIPPNVAAKSSSEISHFTETNSGCNVLLKVGENWQQTLEGLRRMAGHQNIWGVWVHPVFSSWQRKDHHSYPLVFIIHYALIDVN